VDDFRCTEVLGKEDENIIHWVPSKANNWLDNFHSILKRSETSNGISSIKIMSSQLIDIENCLKTTDLEPNGNVTIFPLLRELLKDAVFIRVKRDNVVRQAVSRVMARQTGVNHAISDENSKYKPGNLLAEDANLEFYNAKVEFCNGALDEEVINISKENLLWDEVLNDWGINSPLELHYEQVCRAYPNYIKRVSNYVRVDVDFNSFGKSRNIRKMSNKRNEYFVNRYLKSSFNLI
jgi:LPS sulfotransferase NodH